MANVAIYDHLGGQRGEDWLHDKYGAYVVQPEDESLHRYIFRLTRIDVTDGPAVIQVAVRTLDGKAIVDQPVANHWSDDSLPDLSGKGLKTLYHVKAISQETNGNGDTGFGLGDGSYIRDLSKGGPHTVWVLSPSHPSDGLARIGMLGGTNHQGPLRPTFTLMPVEDKPATPEPQEPQEEPPQTGKNLLSAHIMGAAGWSQEDSDQLKRTQPRVIKVVNGLGRVPQLHKESPHSLFVIRDHPLSEQHDDMRRDPAGTGVRHADEWYEKMRSWNWNIPSEQIVILGINEPYVDTPQAIKTAVDYNVAFLNRLRQHGLRGGALNLSVGWPGNKGGDTPPDWEPFEPVRDAINAGRHLLVLHEYWSHHGLDGPDGTKWGWWGGRALKCPWPEVNILIGECGIEEAVVGGGTGRGWQNYYKDNPQVYMDQLNEYERRMSADPRILGLCVFLWKPSPGFESLDVADIMHMFPENRRWNLALRPVVGSSPTPRPKPSFADRMLAEGEQHQVIQFNTGAALQKQMVEDGFVPNSPEFTFEEYVAQRAENLADGRVRIYYVLPGSWGDVRWVQRDG